MNDAANELPVDSAPATLEQAFMDHLALGGSVDPSSFNARLRNEAPVFWTPNGQWLLSSYSLAEYYYRGDTDYESLWTKHSSHANIPTGMGALSTGSGYASKFFQADIHHRDGADHARLRRLLNKPFRPHAVAGLKESIERIIDELLNTIESSSGSVELIQQFAFQIPTRVILDLLGMPVEHIPLMLEIATSVIASREPRASDWMQRADALFEAGHHVLLDELEQRRRAPRDDVMTQYVMAASDDSEATTDLEWTMNLMFLFVAGHETTASLIGSLIYELLANPDQLALLRANPDLIDGAVEEGLRLRPPVRMSSPRWALNDMEIGGHKIARGDEVNVSFVAVNRDPAVFADPDKFIISRDPNPHFSFAPGSTHYCLGASLARLETRLAIPKIFERFPQMQLDGEPIWKDSFVVWGPSELRVRV